MNNIINKNNEVEKDLCMMETESKKLCDAYLRNMDTCFEYVEKYKELTVREEYAHGGESMHRGVYTPSPIQDIVICNANRGKLYKRLTSSSKISFKYCYDKDDRLFFVVSNPDTDFERFEWISYEGDIEIGIKFMTCPIRAIILVSLCEYKNGMPIRYSVGTGSLYPDRRELVDIDYVRSEEYIYDEVGLKQAFCREWFFARSQDRHVVFGHKYQFEHDDEGYLSRYTVSELYETCRGATFDVKKMIRRKF